MSTRPIAPYLVLAAGVAIVSTASILIRFAQADGVPSLTIAAGRLALAALILTPLAWGRAAPEIRGLTRADLLLAITAGAFLALHFWSWISSLEYTSVASSTALVTTNPLWVALASTLLLRERLGEWTLAGVALTLAGTGAIFLSDAMTAGGALPFDAALRATNAVSRGLALHPDPLLGNLLALAGAVCATGYLLIGRRLRRHVGLLAYVWLAYTSAAVLLLAVLAASGQTLFGLSPLAYLLLLALAAGPQLLGHTAFNWALRHLSATFVALSILGEPVGSALLAWLIFGERFGALQLAGFVLLLTGIYLAARSERP